METVEPWYVSKEIIPAVQVMNKFPEIKYRAASMVFHVVYWAERKTSEELERTLRIGTSQFDDQKE